MSRRRKPEQRKILAYLGGSGTATASQLRRRDRRVALRCELLEESEVQREAADSGLSDFAHAAWIYVKCFTKLPRQPSSVNE